MAPSAWSSYSPAHTPSETEAMTYWLGFRCVDCGSEHHRETPIGLCPRCNGILLAAYDLPALRQCVSRDTFARRPPRLLARWAELMPFADERAMQRASLGETETPLLRAAALGERVGLADLSLKLDLYLPSASLKDRPQSAVVAGAIERGVQVVAISSSGNAGAALAAHSAKAGLKAVIGVFAGVPEAKLAKIRAYGPSLLMVEGGMDTAEHAIRSLCARGGWFNAESFVNPFANEGEKTIAYEIAVACDWNLPDKIFLPLGNAGCVIAPWKGFRELLELGLIARMPQLIGVQFTACKPIAEAFERGDKDIRPFRRQPSFSTTLMHEHPISGALALRAIRDSGGAAIAASDDEVREAMRLMGREAGILAEPAGAIALAGAITHQRAGRIGVRERVLCLVSGSGLNYLDAIEAGGPMTGPLPLDAIEALNPAALV
jgi:threonine synthase